MLCRLLMFLMNLEIKFVRRKLVRSLFLGFFSPSSKALVIKLEEFNKKHNLLLLRNVTFITSYIVYPLRILKQSHNLQKPWTIPGTYNTLLTPARKPSGHKGNYRGLPRQSSFCASCPDFLMRKRFPTGKLNDSLRHNTPEMKCIEHDDTTQPPLIEGLKASISRKDKPSRRIVYPAFFTLAGTLC
ncbi:hypothetical protein CEXT_404851 [Caerostris extrusa]|uniref:Uncharacterized protein n=1 Tax=Caerostris extrusa TaxID=172846 RepID=A0AAV4NRH3_CAEEX|nr:hypothetical protein CEXT_404851 [Caerostris extrusa]